MSRIAARWRRSLRDGGYEPPKVGPLVGLRFAILSRAWRRVLRETGLGWFSPVRALDVGCAGGQQCIRLAANGWRCVGLDSSRRVIGYARRYWRDVRRVMTPRGRLRFVVRDFFSYPRPARGFDLVFHVGVLEHFLNPRERMKFLRRMFEMARPGGWVMSMVPNGRHVLRPAMRRTGLGGYNVPEIDYSSRLVLDEMRRCGATDIRVLHHNVFGYLRIIRANRPVRMVLLGGYCVLQLFPWRLLPRRFLDRHALWLIGLGRRPAK